MAGELTIKGTSYSLQAEATPMRKARFFSEALDLNGNIVVNDLGNSPKRRWLYTGKCQSSVCASLESALDSGVTGTFTDHTGASYSSCRFVFEYNQTGHYSYNCEWTLDVAEV